MDDAALDAAAGQPDGEAERMMVAAVGAFGAGRAAELGGPDDERLVEQAALLQILQQAGDRLIDLRAVGGVVACEIAVGVPAAGAAVAAVEDLHEPHAALDQPPRRQAVLAERRGRRRCPGRRASASRPFPAGTRTLRARPLHAEGQLVRLDAGQRLASSGYSASASRLSRSSSSNSACCSSRIDAVGRPAEGSGFAGSATSGTPSCSGPR